MTDLAGFSGKEVIKRLERIGYRITRQRGSHIRLKHPNGLVRKPITVPLHKELKVGLLHEILKDAGLEIENFLDRT